MQDRSDTVRGILGIAVFLFLLFAAFYSAIMSFTFFVGAPHAFPPIPWLGSIAALLAALLLSIAFRTLRQAVRRLRQ